MQKINELQVIYYIGFQIFQNQIFNFLFKEYVFEKRFKDYIY